jgi:D-glycero-alpha-D-manno-heptose 1-phosphate guanylyltransferase
MCDLSVIILCGGLGTRLRSKIGNETPKILAPIGDYCFFDYLLQWIDDSLDEISYELIFCLGYGSRKIEDKINKLKLKVSLSFEEKQLGTYPAVLDASKLAKSENLLIINGDTLFKMEFEKYFQIFLNSSDSFLFITENNLKKTKKNGYKINRNSGRLEYSEEYPAYISMGALFLKKVYLESFKKKREDINQLLDKELIAKINPYPIKVKNKFDFIDIGTPEDYQYAQTKLPDLYPLKK